MNQSKTAKNLREIEAERRAAKDKQLGRRPLRKPATAYKHIKGHVRRTFGASGRPDWSR
jgi:hypothetical protein